jgi:hypothetical protein
LVLLRVYLLLLSGNGHVHDRQLLVGQHPSAIDLLLELVQVLALESHASFRSHCIAPTNRDDAQELVLGRPILQLFTQQLGSDIVQQWRSTTKQKEINQPRDSGRRQ